MENKRKNRKGKNNSFFGKHHSKTTRQLMSKIKKKYFKNHKSPHWKGGRHKDGDGYILIYCPNHPRTTRYNYVYEHRLIMEKKLGRYLKKEETVRHHLKLHKKELKN